MSSLVRFCKIPNDLNYKDIDENLIDSIISEDLIEDIKSWNENNKNLKDEEVKQQFKKNLECWFTSLKEEGYIQEYNIFEEFITLLQKLNLLTENDLFLNGEDSIIFNLNHKMFS